MNFAPYRLCVSFYALVLQIKSISSGETTRSRNSASCSIERTITSDKVGHTSAKVTYINERRPRPHLHGTNDERFEFKSRPRKLLKGMEFMSKPKTSQQKHPSCFGWLFWGGFL